MVKFSFSININLYLAYTFIFVSCADAVATYLKNIVTYARLERERREIYPLSKFFEIKFLINELSRVQHRYKSIEFKNDKLIREA